MKKLFFTLVLMVVMTGLFAGDVEGYVMHLGGTPASGIFVAFYSWDYNYAQWYEHDCTISDDNGWYSLDLKQDDSEGPEWHKLEAVNPNGTNPRFYYTFWPGYIYQDIYLTGYIEP